MLPVHIAVDLSVLMFKECLFYCNIYCNIYGTF